MITKLVLENFKCFRKIEVDPRLITIFIGPNGTGKSSVLQALALIRQSLGGTELHFEGQLVNLSGYSAITPNFGPPDDARFSIEIAGEEHAREALTMFIPGKINYVFNAKFSRGHREASWGSLDFEFNHQPTKVQTSPEIQEYQATMGQYKFSVRGNADIAGIGVMNGWMRSTPC